MEENEHPNRTSILYSQNRLRSRELVRHLILESSITGDDVVVETGPGNGIITAELARRCREVIAIEIDVDLYGRLRQTFAQTPNVKLHLRDFLSFTLPKSPYKVFSNIPYNITADVIRKLVEADVPPEDSYLVLQWEAATRVLGLPYGGETVFSLLIKPWFEPMIVHRFERRDFLPVPGVDSVLLRIRKREHPLVVHDNTQSYRDFIVYGFVRWRSTVREALKDILTHRQLLRLAADLQFDLLAQPSQLDFTQWLGLFNYLLVGVEAKRRRVLVGSEAKLRKQQAGLQRIHRTTVAGGRKANRQSNKGLL